MHGGDISEAFTLGDGVRTFFVKTQPAPRPPAGRRLVPHVRPLAMPKQKRRACRAGGGHAVRVPQVICQGVAEGSAYLVLEYLPLDGRTVMQRCWAGSWRSSTASVPRNSAGRATTGSAPRRSRMPGWTTGSNSGARTGWAFNWNGLRRTDTAAPCSAMVKR
jgi:hypothetical protein